MTKEEKQKALARERKVMADHEQKEKNVREKTETAKKKWALEREKQKQKKEKDAQKKRELQSEHNRLFGAKKATDPEWQKAQIVGQVLNRQREEELQDRHCGSSDSEQYRVAAQGCGG